MIIKTFLSVDFRITRFDCFVDYQNISNILMSDRIKISYTEFLAPATLRRRNLETEVHFENESNVFCPH